MIEGILWVWLGVSAIVAIVSSCVMGSATFEGKSCSRVWLRLLLFAWAWPLMVVGLILWESHLIAFEVGQLAALKWRALFPHHEPRRLGPERGAYRTRGPEVSAADAIEVLKQIDATIYKEP